MTRTFFKTLNRLNDSENEVLVEYSITTYHPATYDDPAEGGEVEIIKICCEHCDSEVKITDAEEMKFIQLIAESHDYD